MMINCFIIGNDEKALRRLHLFGILIRMMRFMRDWKILVGKIRRMGRNLLMGSDLF